MLRSNNDLNVQALKTLSRSVDIFLFPLLIIMIVFLIYQFYYGNIGKETPIMFIIIILAYYPLYIRGLWRTYHASFVLGEKTNGNVKKICVASGGAVRIHVENNQTKSKHIVCMCIPFKFSNPYYLPKVGQDIDYYCVEEDPEFYVPNPTIFEYMEKYCLKKSLFRRARPSMFLLQYER